MDKKLRPHKKVLHIYYNVCKHQTYKNFRSAMVSQKSDHRDLYRYLKNIRLLAKLKKLDHQCQIVCLIIGLFDSRRCFTRKTSSHGILYYHIRNTFKHAHTSLYSSKACTYKSKYNIQFMYTEQRR